MNITFNDNATAKTYKTQNKAYRVTLSLNFVYVTGYYLHLRIYHIEILLIVMDLQQLLLFKYTIILCYRLFIQ